MGLTVPFPGCASWNLWSSKGSFASSALHVWNFSFFNWPGTEVLGNGCAVAEQDSSQGTEACRRVQMWKFITEGFSSYVHLQGTLPPGRWGGGWRTVLDKAPALDRNIAFGSQKRSAGSWISTRSITSYLS